MSISSSPTLVISSTVKLYRLKSCAGKPGSRLGADDNTNLKRPDSSADTPSIVCTNRNHAYNNV